LEADTRELNRAISELVRVYRCRDRDRICCYDVSVTQCHALEAIADKGPVTMNELAGLLYLDKSTASRVVDALERKAYIERRENPGDKRALQLMATPSGRRLMRRIRADILEQEMKLVADFEPAVRRSMAQLIRQLAQAASERVDPMSGTCCTVE
jgi:DNA-binding MarR family transcriptional regulator